MRSQGTFIWACHNPVVADLTRRRLLAGSGRPGRRGAPALDDPAPASVGPRGEGRHERTTGHAATGGGHAGFRDGRDGRPRRQRLRPARDRARLRLGHDAPPGRAAASLREWELDARRQGDRGRARRDVRRLDLQRPHPRADAALPRGRAAADHVRQRLARTRTRSTSTASTRPRWTACPGSAPGRSSPGGSTVYEFDALPAGLHLYHCHVRPLAEHIAKGLYGAFIVDPRGRPRGRRRARDGDERVRHELRPRQRALRRQHDRLRLHGPADRGHARRARAGLPRQRARVRPRSTRSTCTATCSTTSRPGTSQDAVRADRHGDALPGPARDPRVALPVSPGATCSTRTSPSSPSSAGRASSRSR